MFLICSGTSKIILERSKLSLMFLSHASMIVVLSSINTASELVSVTFSSILPVNSSSFLLILPCSWLHNSSLSRVSFLGMY